jgi:nucleotide-binding universal stress UspA family protein
MAGQLREHGLQVETVVDMSDDPAKTIIERAREGGFDLIAMATHGRGGLNELVKGTAASRVLKSDIAPVVLVRPTKS